MLMFHGVVLHDVDDTASNLKSEILLCVCVTVAVFRLKILCLCFFPITTTEFD